MLLRSHLIACLLGLGLTLGGAEAAKPPVTVVPPEVATAMQKAQETADPVLALNTLDAYQGPAHALVHLMRGQLAARVANLPATQDAIRTQRKAQAKREFTAALALDGTLTAAQLGLAQLAADAGDWKEACRRCAVAIDLATATAQELLFYAHAAEQAHDRRLTTVLVNQGIARFPDELLFRRLELALLVRGGRAEEARQAIFALLDHAPADADLWRNLVWCAQELGRTDEMLAGLELALAARPDDRGLRLQLAQTQIVQHLPHAALATVTPLVGNPPGAAFVADAALIDMAVRAAADAGEIAQARAWLGAVPTGNRTRPQRLQGARLAVQAGDLPSSTAAVKELVALGERDPAVLAWAGQVAEQGKDEAAAEAFYTQAAVGDNAAAATAGLRLAALYLRQERLDDARTVLATYLAQHPADLQARALQDQIERRSR